MHSITNDFLMITASEHGAELHSIKQVDNGFEFLWNANPDVWNRHAPILFPIVGKLNNNKIIINGNSYQMNQHGFARDNQFELVNKTETALCFELKSNAKTLEQYPFHFKLHVIYSFTQLPNELKCTYKIFNTNHFEMPFSIGAHPGFKLPVSDLNQYEIYFDSMNEFDKHLLSDGLFNNETRNIELTNNRLQLNAETFNEDAIVIKNAISKEVAIIHKKSNYKVSCKFDDFNDLGIWCKKGNQDFICLEPWNGFADELGFTNEITAKKGIIKLPANEQMELNYFLNFSS